MDPVENIVALVDEGVRLHEQIEALERKKKRLDEIKAELRKIAGDRDISFPGSIRPDGSVPVALVEQKGDCVCRVVAAADLPRAVKLAGASVFDLFTLHPSKGNERNFELNALKALPKAAAGKLLALLRVPATAHVKFS